MKYVTNMGQLVQMTEEEWRAFLRANAVKSVVADIIPPDRFGKVLEGGTVVNVTDWTKEDALREYRQVVGKGKG